MGVGNHDGPDRCQVPARGGSCAALPSPHPPGTRRRGPSARPGSSHCGARWGCPSSCPARSRRRGPRGEVGREGCARGGGGRRRGRGGGAVAGPGCQGRAGVPAPPGALPAAEIGVRVGSPGLEGEVASLPGPSPSDCLAARCRSRRRSTPSAAWCVRSGSAHLRQVWRRFATFSCISRVLLRRGEDSRASSGPGVRCPRPEHVRVEHCPPKRPAEEGWGPLAWQRQASAWTTRKRFLHDGMAYLRHSRPEPFSMAGGSDPDVGSKAIPVPGARSKSTAYNRSNILYFLSCGIHIQPSWHLGRWSSFHPGKMPMASSPAWLRACAQGSVLEAPRERTLTDSVQSEDL